ncbi:MAG: hypothetical protein OXC28_07075 [Defluviicoccus sp.]|nr:hypothetical protein [Defluviicoccus sp.]
MIYDAFRAALFLLADEGALVLPHGVAPRLDEDTVMSAALWRRTGWNPPAEWDHLTEADPAASARPAYATVTAAAARLTAPPADGDQG